MTTQPLSAASASDVRTFVVQVRAALDDLAPETVDELTTGLEADLADAQAESPTAWRDGVGSPSAYAAELRAAAGLPPREVAPSGEGVRALADDWRALWRDSSASTFVERWYRELRSAGWVLRGVAAALAVGVVLGRGPWLLAVIFVPLSIWVGIRAREGHGWARVLGAAGAAIAVPVLLVAAAQRNTPPDYYVESGRTWVSPHPYNGGKPIRNLYGFDADGKRVDGLRLFDQDGRQLRVSVQGTRQSAYPVVAPGQGQRDLWTPVSEQAWTPPMAIAPVGSGPEATVTRPSEPRRSSSTSTSSGSSSSTSRTGSWSASPTPSPRSTNGD